MTNKDATIQIKIKFIMLIGKSLHRYGASADRIEKALSVMCNNLAVNADFFSLPTGIFASFKTLDDEFTRMERLEPGKINLAKLYYVDEIVDQAVDKNAITIEEGIQRTLDVLSSDVQYNNFQSTLGCSLVAMSICIFLNGTWTDAIASIFIGLFVGFFAESVKEERIDSVSDGINSFLVTIFTIGIGFYYPINTNIVILSSLITLVPGLSVTMAVGELASQNLTSGTARLLGASMIMLKISFGIYIGNEAMKYFGILNNSTPLTNHPLFIIIPMLIISAIGFSITFQARVKDTIWIIFAAFLSYFSADIFSSYLGPIAGILCSGTIIGAASNLFSRLMNRPALIFLLPALILLVPGSVGFQGLNLLFTQDMIQGINTMFRMASIAVALVSGTYFGSILIKPRRSL
jgi:uncharacterized membrane protein YjjP (DUF1212 family)